MEVLSQIEIVQKLKARDLLINDIEKAMKTAKGALEASLLELGSIGIFSALSWSRLIELYDECYSRCPSPPRWVFWMQRRHKAKVLAQCVQMHKEWLQKVNREALIKTHFKEQYLAESNVYIKTTSNLELDTIIKPEQAGAAALLL